MCAAPCLIERALARALASSSDSLGCFTGGGAGRFCTCARLRSFCRVLRPKMSTCAVALRLSTAAMI